MEMSATSIWLLVALHIFMLTSEIVWRRIGGKKEEKEEREEMNLSFSRSPPISILIATDISRTIYSYKSICVSVYICLCSLPWLIRCSIHRNFLHVVSATSQQHYQPDQSCVSKVSSHFIFIFFLPIPWQCWHSKW